MKVTSNKSKRTFTLRTGYATYRTYKMSKEEFNSNLHNTDNDWKQFLKSDEYYKVK